MSNSEKLLIWSKALFNEILSIGLRIVIVGFCLFMLLYWLRSIVYMALGIDN